MISNLLDKIPISAKFRKDTIWNIVSLGLFGITGLVISFGISRLYPPQILGIFNINFALIMILSQFAGAGIHYSVLHKISLHAGKPEFEKEIISGGMLAGIVSSLSVVLIIALTLNVFGVLYDDPADSSTILYILPAVALLPLNKIILAFHNARREMITFAFANIIRAVTMLTTALVLIAIEYEPKNLAILFSFSEATVFVLYFIKTFKFLKLRTSKSTIVEHFNYGFRSLLGNITQDINTKVDIIMLGLLLDDFSVGIYTLPALIVEGFHQIPLVLRQMVNPLITKTYSTEGKKGLESLVKRGVRLTYKLLIPVGVLIYILYPIVINLLGLEKAYNAGIIPLIILLTGSLISIGYMPFITIFNQLNHPKTQSMFFFLIFTSNIILNLVLIPFFGVSGAALGTSVSFILSILLMRRILNNKYEVKV